jgi:hypothetical protein
MACVASTLGATMRSARPMVNNDGVGQRMDCFSSGKQKPAGAFGD